MNPITALAYHHVGPPTDRIFRGLSISGEVFSRQMQHVRRCGFETLSLRQFEQAINGNQPCGRAVLITFDDAYADLIKFALPVLVELNLKAVAFVVSSRIGATGDWDREHVAKPAQLMGANDLERWLAAGMEIGGHSRTHRRLTHISTGMLADEIGGCKSDLDALTGSNIQSFAYPYGAYDDRVVACARQFYAMGFTCDIGRNRRAGNRLELRRTTVQSTDTDSSFNLRLRHGTTPFDLVRHVAQCARASIVRPTPHFG